MESPAEAATTDPAARTFSQVVFTNIPHSYPLLTNVTCCYTLTAAFEPNPRDWVGIFKVGWSTTKDYHTFVWVEPCLDVAGQQSVTRQAVFKDYYLPKDEMEFYQFCYVDSSGQVRGASTPFCFRNPVEQSMESNPDDDLLVVTTQEQVEQSVREKAELQKELDQIMEENESLKRALEDGQQEATSLKRQNEEREEEKTQLVEEMVQIKEENENLKSSLEQQLKETEHLKETLTQVTKQMETHERNTAEQQKASSDKHQASRQNEAHMQEKYDRAVMKINQLKEERQELRGKVDAQSEEIATLKSKIREEERKLFNMKDSIQLLQVDLQSSEKEKERLSAELQRLQSLTRNMDEVKRENQELCRRLSQQDTLQNCRDEEDLRCQTLVCQLQDTQEKLAAAKDESKISKRRVEYLDGELVQVRKQLENLNVSHEQGERINGKLELQLREAREAIADKDTVIEEKERIIKLLSGEKEELTRESQNLISDLEELRRVYADLQAASPAEPPHMQPDTTSPAGLASSTHEWPETPEQSENLYENIGGVAEEEEESLECCHCHERFPFITRLELEQHEQSHRICPFCSMVCDNMEQSAFEDHVYSHEL